MCFFDERDGVGLSSTSVELHCSAERISYLRVMVGLELHGNACFEL